jgi:hypothetical protein
VASSKYLHTRAEKSGLACKNLGAAGNSGNAGFTRAKPALSKVEGTREREGTADLSSEHVLGI